MLAFYITEFLQVAYSFEEFIGSNRVGHEFGSALAVSKDDKRGSRQVVAALECPGPMTEMDATYTNCTSSKIFLFYKDFDTKRKKTRWERSEVNPRLFVSKKQGPHFVDIDLPRGVNDRFKDPNSMIFELKNDVFMVVTAKDSNWEQGTIWFGSTKRKRAAYFSPLGRNDKVPAARTCQVDPLPVDGGGRPTAISMNYKARRLGVSYQGKVFIAQDVGKMGRPCFQTVGHPITFPEDVLGSTLNGSFSDRDVQRIRQSFGTWLVMMNSKIYISAVNTGPHPFPNYVFEYTISITGKSMTAALQNIIQGPEVPPSKRDTFGGIFAVTVPRGGRPLLVASTLGYNDGAKNGRVQYLVFQRYGDRWGSLKTLSLRPNSNDYSLYGFSASGPYLALAARHGGEDARIELYELQTDGYIYVGKVYDPYPNKSTQPQTSFGHDIDVTSTGNVFASAPRSFGQRLNAHQDGFRKLWFGRGRLYRFKKKEFNPKKEKEFKLLTHNSTNPTHYFYNVCNSTEI